MREAGALPGREDSVTPPVTVLSTARSRARSVVLGATFASLLAGLVWAPVAAISSQTITFTAPASAYTAELLHLSATASSGLPVSFTSETTDICTIEGNVALLLSPGTCTIRASQAGDGSYAPAPDVTRSVDVLEPPPGPQPQSITFELPDAGYVGSTFPLAGYTTSPLAISYATLTPSVCVTDGTKVALDAAGTCTVKASQAGNVEWQPASDVTTSMESRVAPFGTGTTALGRYAFNGPIYSVELDDATGDTWVAGQFTQMGARTGSVARVDGPGSGSDALDAASPDVIGSEVAVFPDDATGYLVSGHIGSTNGDGVLREWLQRMNADGTRDTGWSSSTTCVGTDLPNWARFRPMFDLGPWIGAPIQMAATGSLDSTLGLALIDKATGLARRTGAGDGTCGAGGRLWSGIAPLPALASCAGWNTCNGFVLDARYDEPSHTLLTWSYLTRRQATSGTYDVQDWLVAYDTQSGSRRWAVRLESASRPPGYPDTATWQGQVSRLAVVGGAVFAGGRFMFEPVNPDDDHLTTTALFDVATGTLLQRWNRLGEQSLAAPQGASVAPATSCLPMSDDTQFHLAATDGGHAVGYGMSNGANQFAVCDYSSTGSGLAAKASASSLGTLVASPHPSYVRQLPDTIVGGRYLTGPFDAFDLEAGAQVAGWHPSPSTDVASVAALGSDVVFGGEFTFLHGVPMPYVARLTPDLAPVETFASGLAETASNTFIWGMRRLGDRLLVYGYGLEAGAGPADIAALDGQTGAVVWATPSSQQSTLAVGVDEAAGAFYAGGDSQNGQVPLRRFVTQGGAYAVDGSFAPALTGISGGPANVMAVDLVGSRLYVGGNFSKVDGVSRQGLARFDGTLSLDSWAPKLITEIDPPADAVAELRPKVFLELGGRTIVGGAFWFNYPNPYGEGSISTERPSPLLVYDGTTGARVRPAVGAGSWFGADSTEATDATVLGSSLYVALGQEGIGAFDVSTLDYQAYRSIRTFPGWGNNAIFALMTRQGTIPLAMTAGTRIASAAVIEPSLVVGGDLPRWKSQTAGNVVDLGAGVLNADHTPPTVSSAQARPRTGVTLGSGLPFWVTWAAADKGGAGVARYEVAQSRNGAPWTILKVDVSSPHLAVVLTSGKTYRFRIRAIDKAGNVGTWAYSTSAATGLVQQSSRHISWRGAWHTASSSKYSGGSARYARASGARASYTFTGRAIALVTTAGPTRGKARIYVDGHLVKTVDLKASSTTYRYVPWYRSWSSRSTHTIRVVVLGTSGRPRFDVDGFVTWK